MPTASPETMSLPVEGYAPPDHVFDELHRAESWQPVCEAITAIPPDERRRMWQRADRFVVENGTIYNAFHDQNATVRPWTIDLFPFVFDEAEYRRLQAGLTQRARLLQAIVSDIYGPQRLLRHLGLPPRIVYDNPSYERAFRHLLPDDTRGVLLCGFELARGPDGDWYVMADRLDSPAGCGYALENRLAVSRTLPRVIKDTQVLRLAPFFEQIQLALRAAAIRNRDDPRIVLLSGGPNSTNYFEDVFLARYLGYLLVQSSDLAVRDNAVFVKTIDGLLAVDVVFNRSQEAGLDPLECGQSGIGVTGLVNAIRQGKVAVVNRPGCGLLESPVWMPYLGSLCEALLGEKLLLPSIATWWCGTEKALGVVLDRLDEFIIKPAFAYSGGQEIDVAQLSQKERDKLLDDIRASPEQYVAQQKIERSAMPSWRQDGLQTGHVALRAFVAATPRTADAIRRDGSLDPDQSFMMMPGALARVADDTEPLELSITAGHSSKDVWVRTTAPVQPKTLLRSASSLAKPRRNAHLVPCRVADHMFWFGRKLDRLDVAARLLRAVVERVDSDQTATALPELQPLLSALVGQSLIDRKEFAAIKTLALGTTEGALMEAVIDADDPNSLRGLVRGLRQTASNLRDRLSADTWKASRRLDELINVTEPRAFLAGEGIVLLDNLIAGLATVSGLINDGAVRGAAWRFFNIGRQIGRGERTIEFLLDAWIKPRRSAVPVGSPLRSGPSDDERALLEAVIEVMDARITYRSRYLADSSPTLVLDLLVFDETNPRSLAHLITTLNHAIDALPRDPDEVGLIKLQVAIRRAAAALQLNEPDITTEADPQLQRKKTAALLRTLAKQLRVVSSETTRRYLVLSRSPREREEGSIRLS